MRISDWSSDVCSSDLLLHEVVAADALDAAVDRQVALLLKAGPVASAQAKSLVRDVAWLRDRDAIDVANADLIARLRVSPEGQEGLSSLLDKRSPRSEEHTSELQSLIRLSSAVICFKSKPKKDKKKTGRQTQQSNT